MSIFNFLIKNNIDEPPWDYYFLQNLEEKEYPKYLAKIFNYRTGEKLPLKYDFQIKNWIIDKNKCKTFNQKLQWLKLYGITPLMRDCTDKVKVRNYVKEKIGEEYLKPVLQIIPNESHETVCCHCEQVNDNSGLARQSGDISHDIPDCRVAQMTAAPRLRFPKFQFRENWVLAEYNDGEPNAVSTYFDQIDFDRLPNSFVIKTNHGCKWHCIIKNKSKLLANKKVSDTLRTKITGWLEQEFWMWEGFELNYKNLEHKILIEPYMPASRNIQIYFFNAVPQIFVDIQLKDKLKICTYNYDFSFSDLILKKDDKEFMQKFNADEILKQTLDLSKPLAEDFTFVRIDWIVFNNVINFEELTFTPYSGFMEIEKKWNRKLGSFLNL